MKRTYSDVSPSSDQDSTKKTNSFVSSHSTTFASHVPQKTSTMKVLSFNVSHDPHFPLSPTSILSEPSYNIECLDQIVQNKVNNDEGAFEHCDTSRVCNGICNIYILIFINSCLCIK
jgi:hypothetical protein